MPMKWKFLKGLSNKLVRTLFDFQKISWAVAYSAAVLCHALYESGMNRKKAATPLFIAVNFIGRETTDGLGDH